MVHSFLSRVLTHSSTTLSSDPSLCISPPTAGGITTTSAILAQQVALPPQALSDRSPCLSWLPPCQAKTLGDMGPRKPCSRFFALVKLRTDNDASSCRFTTHFLSMGGRRGGKSEMGKSSGKSKQSAPSQGQMKGETKGKRSQGASVLNAGVVCGVRTPFSHSFESAAPCQKYSK
jgi:hypothetical protein